MATFVEWADRHGMDSAKRQFRVAPHMVFIVRPKHSVFGICGNWKGSEPLGMGATIEEAKQSLRKAIGFAFETEEEIINDA